MDWTARPSSESTVDSPNETLGRARGRCDLERRDRDSVALAAEVTAASERAAEGTHGLPTDPHRDHVVGGGGVTLLEQVQPDGEGTGRGVAPGDVLVLLV